MKTIIGIVYVGICFLPLFAIIIAMIWCAIRNDGNNDGSSENYYDGLDPLKKYPDPADDYPDW